MSRFHLALTHIKTLPSAFWIVIAATLMNQVGNMALVFLMIYLNQHLGFNLTQASTAFATFSGSMVLAGLLGGTFIDKMGAARMMTGAILTNGLILLTMPFIHHYLALLCMCAIWGLAYGLYRSASSTLVSHLSTQGMHKITFSVYRLVINLGMSIGPALGGYLADYSYAAIFYTNGFANLLAGIILIIGLIHTAWFNYRPALLHKMEFSLKWLKHDAALCLFLLSIIPVGMVFFQHEATLPIFLHTNLKFPLSFYGLLFTLNTLIIVFTELPLNIATMHWSYRVNFMLGSIFTTAGFAGLYFATQQWHVILLTILWTIGEMILFPASNSYIADIAPPAHRGSYISLYNTSSNLGLLLGPLGGAIVMEHMGAQGLWIVCGLWGCISVILFYFTKQPSLVQHQNEKAQENTG